MPSPANLYPQGFAHGWQAVTCVENHDIVKVGTDLRIPALADGSNPRIMVRAQPFAICDWHYCSRAPGIPQIFMGQEFLEDKQWSWDPSSPNLIWWAGLNPERDTAQGESSSLYAGSDPAALELSCAAWRQRESVSRSQPESRECISSLAGRHRAGRDRGRHSRRRLRGTTTASGFRFGGPWREVFNSDVYDNWVNPIVAGNGGGINASGPPLHGFPASANIVIPANGFVVFART